MDRKRCQDNFPEVRYGYGANERTVTHVLGEKWDNPAVPPLVPYSATFGRQFRYDGARQRYLNRELDPSDWQGYLDEVLSETWSDYDGDSIYGDWTLDGTERMPLRSYEPGLATTDQLAGGGPENTMYLHTNALGSTMATSDQYGLGTFNTAYTAFGERITGPFQRYGFAGARGYQSHEDFPYLHLGHRYYNPETGRFLQRDPIGIAGGPNIYGYGPNTPVSGVDVSGEDWKGVVGGGGVWLTGGDDSWLDDQESVRKWSRRARKVSSASASLACGFYGGARLAAVRGFRWLNKGPVRIGPGRIGGGWNYRIGFGRGPRRIHIPITRPQPILPGKGVGG